MTLKGSVCRSILSTVSSLTRPCLHLGLVVVTLCRRRFADSCCWMGHGMLVSYLALFSHTPECSLTGAHGVLDGRQIVVLIYLQLCLHVSFQKLKVMQRKLEENEEALLGRAQVVDLLQQELTSAEQRNQVLAVVPLPARGGLVSTVGCWAAGRTMSEPSEGWCPLFILFSKHSVLPWCTQWESKHSYFPRASGFHLLSHFSFIVGGKSLSCRVSSFPLVSFFFITFPLSVLNGSCVLCMVSALPIFVGQLSAGWKWSYHAAVLHLSC